MSDIREKARRRYMYSLDTEAQACVAAASKAWLEEFVRYYPIPGTDMALRIGPPRSVPPSRSAMNEDRENG